jgi:DNA sulfur modification protein DndD
MKIRHLSIENYKSFQFKTDINFPLSEEHNAIFLIGGMNGAGKSSIMEAIIYCLYGCKSDEIFRSINRKEKAKQNTYVAFELTMDADDGSELIVKRSWTAGIIDDPKPNDLVEKLVVIQDGQRVSVQSNDIWNDYLKATIPQSITQFFFFDGEKIQEIASDDHSEVRLKASLEAALGIEYINILSKDINYIKNRAKQNFVEVTDTDIEYKAVGIKKEQKKMEKLIKERAELTCDLSDFQKKLEDARERFQTIFHKAPETKEIIRKNEVRRAQLVVQRNQLESEIKRLCEEYLPISITGRLFDNLKNQLIKERESLQNDVIKENAREIAQKIIVAVNEPEPIYHEVLTEDKQEELVNRVYKLLKEGLTGDSISKVLNLSERDASRLLNQLESLEKSEVFMIPPKIEEKREIEQIIKQLDVSITSGSASESEKELFEELQQEIEGCSTQIGRLKEQLHNIEDDISIIDNKIKDMESELEKLYANHSQSKERADFITECDTIMDLLNKYIIILRKNKVEMLEDKTFEMYKRLSSRSDQIKDLTINDKTYEIKITDKNGHEIKKSSLSAGEKEVFAISLLWGLAQTSQLKLPIIIDTPLSRLDSSHRENIVKNYFPNAGEQVVILSTDTEIDKTYYTMLKPYLSSAAKLEYDKKQEMTLFSEGYFWEE